MMKKLAVLLSAGTLFMTAPSFAASLGVGVQLDGVAVHYTDYEPRHRVVHHHYAPRPVVRHYTHSRPVVYRSHHYYGGHHGHRGHGKGHDRKWDRHDRRWDRADRRHDRRDDRHDRRWHDGSNRR